MKMTKSRPDKGLGIALIASILIISTFSTLRINVQAQVQPVMKIVDPATGLTTTTIARPGEPIPAEGFPFTVNVVLSVAEPFELSAFQVSVRFNGTLMNCTSATMNKTDPSFVFFGKSPITVSPQIVVLQGVFYAFWGATLLEPISVSAGQYLLGRVNFTASKLANSTLQIIPVAEGDPEYPDAAFLLDADLHDVAFSFENCQVTALAALIAPHALFSFTPTDPEPLQDILFNASASSDADGQIVSYRWDFGDNATEYSTTSYINHSYAVAGQHTVNLTVSDNDGLNASAVSEITVGRYPTALFFYTPFGMAIVNMPVAFDASASFVPYGNITSYMWDFGDGNTTSTTQRLVTHPYSAQGFYNVNLTVVATSGLNSTSTQILVVFMPTLISVSTASTPEKQNFGINITGTLTDVKGAPLGNQVILTYYTLSDTGVPVLASPAITSDSGMFNLHWIPLLNETISLRVQFVGDLMHLASAASINLSTLATLGGQVFVVESNSTIGGLEFNGANHTLTFMVTGEDGTRGYAKITIAKDLQPNIVNIKVYVNGTEQQYSYTSTDQAWEIMMTYNQSNDQINIVLEQATLNFFGLDWRLLLVIVLAGAVIATTILLLSLRKKSGKVKAPTQNPPNPPEEPINAQQAFDWLDAGRVHIC
jgi:PKD repeat protein